MRGRADKILDGYQWFQFVRHLTPSRLTERTSCRPRYSLSAILLFTLMHTIEEQARNFTHRVCTMDR